jgi:hypothetical protein
MGIGVRNMSAFEGLRDLILSPCEPDESEVFDFEKAWETFKMERYRARQRYMEYLGWLKDLGLLPGD